MPDMSVESLPSSQPSHIEVEEVTTIIRTPMLRPTPAFLRVIQFGGGTGETFTMNEILNHVKKYIEDRKLYDERDPRIIYCRGNDLGAAFNVDSFTISEVKSLFSKHCFEERDSHLRINKQVFTRPLFREPSVSSSQGTVVPSAPIQSSTSLPTSSPLSSSTSSQLALSPSSSISSSSLLSSTFKHVEMPQSPMKWQPTPNFLKVIHLGGGKGVAFTMNEMIKHVQRYIVDRKLYDEQDPRIVFCNGNDLGSAFNVDSFNVFEVRNLFKKHCHPVSISDSQNPDKQRENIEAEIQCVSSSHSVSSSQDVVKDELRSTPSSSCPPPPPSSLPSSFSVSRKSPSFQKASCHSPKSKSPSVTAAHPSTVITSRDLEVIEVDESSICLPSTSVSVTAALDETDGVASPWTCQVTVGTSREMEPKGERVRRNSVVVEYSSDNFSVEYELVSSSEPEPSNIGDADESENSPCSTRTAALLVVCEESDIEYLADYSDTESDSDAELCDEDKWLCSNCKFKNSALYRNCSKCWNIRPDWLPSRSTDMDCAKNTSVKPDNEGEEVMSVSGSCPKHKQSSMPTVEEINDGSDETSPDCPSPFPCPNQVFSQDSAIGSMGCSQEQENCTVLDLLDEKLEKTGNQQQNIKPTGVEVDSKKKSKSKKRRYSSCLSDSQEEVEVKGSAATECKGVRSKDDKTECEEASRGKDDNEGSQALTDPCVICLTRAKTACIIHGKTGHQVCCYRCARRLKKQRKSCPICRRPIQRVVRNFF